MRYRMLGGEAVARLGDDVAGRFVDEIAGGIRLAILEALYELCRDARAAVYAQSRLGAPGEDVVVHRLMLPLSDDGETVTHCIAIEDARLGLRDVEDLMPARLALKQSA